MNDLKNEIYDYWTNRARGYSEYNQQEMADARRTMWRDKLLRLLNGQFPEKKPQEIQILDVGTGPGFFAILLTPFPIAFPISKIPSETHSVTGFPVSALIPAFTWLCGPKAKRS